MPGKHGNLRVRNAALASAMHDPQAGQIVRPGSFLGAPWLGYLERELCGAPYNTKHPQEVVA
jgi:hypothetical protein